MTPTKTLTKSGFTEKLSDLGLNKREAREIVDMFFEELTSTLESGEFVRISGLGRFELRDKKPRTGRNPKTGEEIPITPRRVVTFKAGQKLKSKIELYARSQQ